MKVRITLLFAILILTACGGTSEKTGVTLQAADPASQPTAEPVSAADTADLAAFNSQPGRLVFAKGKTLYLYPHGDDPDPVVLAEDFNPDTLMFTPDGKGLMFTVNDRPDYGPLAIAHVDLTTLEQTILTTTYNGSGAIIASWSPDGEWAAVQILHRGYDLVKLDGSATYEIARTRLAEVFWLTDGTLLVLDESTSTSAGTRYKSANRFDPTTGTATPLDVDLDALAADPTLLQSTLDALGAAIIEPPVPEPAPIAAPLENDREACSPWRIVTQTPVEGGDTVFETAYEAPAVYRLSDVSTLPDGSLLFLQTTMPDCRFSESPVVALMHLAPGEEPVSITDGVFAGFGAGNLGSTQGRYATAPDGHAVVWVSGDLTDGTTALHLADLQTGAQSLLISERSTGLTGTFVDTQLLSAVYWAK